VYSRECHGVSTCSLVVVLDQATGLGPTTIAPRRFKTDMEIIPRETLSYTGRDDAQLAGSGHSPVHMHGR